MLSASKILKRGICMQKRTGAHKKFTVSYKGRILKFPYTKEQVDRIKDIYDTLQKCGCDHLSPPISYTLLNNDINGPKGDYYIEYEDLGNGSMEDAEVEEYKEKNTGFKYKVVGQRVNLVKLGTYMSENVNDLPRFVWLLQHATSVVCTLIAAMVFCVGDLCFANILVNLDTRKIYCIDFDDQCSKPVYDGVYFYLSRRPSSDYYMIWNHYIDKEYCKQFVRRNKEAFEDIYGCILKNCKSSSFGNKNYTYNPIDMGKMKYSFRHSITYSGLPIDQVKSQLQKSIRRGELDKALMCATEMYMMKHCCSDAKPLITNLYNRMATIACEDIGPANIALSLAVCSKTILKDCELDELLSIVAAMCTSVKSRVLSHINKTFTHPQGRKFARKEGIVLDKECKERSILRKYWNYDSNMGLDKESKKFFCMFSYRLQKGDIRCFQWFGKFAAGVEDIKITNLNRRKDPFELLWEEMKPRLRSTAYDVLRQYYYNKTRDSRIFILFAIFLAIKEDNTKRCRIDTIQIPEDIENRTYNLVISDEAIDMHTSEGRKKKKSRSEFIGEGSLVTNESLEYSTGLYKIYHDIYNKDYKKTK